MNEVNSLHALLRYVLCHMRAVLIFLSAFSLYAGQGPRTEISLNGSATGGALSLMEVRPVVAGFASVLTTQGESAEVVLKRLLDEIVRSDPFFWHNTPAGRLGDLRVIGNTLSLPRVGPWPYCFSGTDKGFGIAKPVLSVSGSYDADRHQVSLSWINPPETYDVIRVGSLTFPPHTTNCVYKWQPDGTRRVSFGIVRGMRGESVSPPASIMIGTNSQEELDTFPFYMGIAPNWSSWSDSTNHDAVECEQGMKPNMDLQARGDPWDKPLYQVIRTRQVAMRGGVWRRFLGLTSGHTYKIEARLNTLQMDVCTNEWEFSFHVAYDNPDGRGLSATQIAGASALPDGSKGRTAGRVARFGPGWTTNGEWVNRSTDKSGSRSENRNITLPDKVTSITVWLRLSGVASSGVGMDWIRVEDLH